MTLFEWQFVGDNEWIFGVKVRGVIRKLVAEIYYDEDSNDRRGGWVWMTYQDGGMGTRGKSISRTFAIIDAEEALGIKDD